MDLTPMLAPVRDLGGFIREQRHAAELSVRALAQRSGISNPYLSQVERGLRTPSAAVLAQLAEGLSISVESLLTRAGVLPDRSTQTPVEEAIRSDPQLSEKHKVLLIDTYRVFLDHPTPTPQSAPHPAPPATP